LPRDHDRGREEVGFAATKPIPFEIIPLQTIRKENNWKTEEALARAAVTGDGTDQRVQSLMFMMMMMMMMMMTY